MEVPEGPGGAGAVAASAAVSNGTAGLTPPPDTSAAGTTAFWDVNVNSGVVGDVTTPPDEGVDGDFKMGIDGEDEVFEEQFGALVDFGEGGVEGGEMVGAMHGESGGVYDGDWGWDGGVWRGLGRGSC